jgi:hypothetical protein
MPKDDKKDDKKEKKDKDSKNDDKKDKDGGDKKDAKRRKKEEKKAKKAKSDKHVDDAATSAVHLTKDFEAKFRAAQTATAPAAASSSSSSGAHTATAAASGGTVAHQTLGHGVTNANHPYAIAGKAPGLEIWRIEQFKVVPWNAPGQFCVGDSYVLLHTQKVGAKFSWDVFFWIGSESTQDEYGSAAISAVDLDEALGGAAVQHRECQGFESDQFCSLFSARGGVVYLEGGVATGFHHVEVNKPDMKPRLLHMKGRRNVRMSQVPLRADSMNSGDVFILDCGNDIYVWNGKSSSPQERVKGGEVARGLRGERGGRPNIVTMQEGDAEEKKLLTFLEGDADDILDADEAGSDADAEKQAEKKLFKLSDAGGQLKFTEVAKGRIPWSALDTNDVFILDAGHEVCAWIGDKASASERKGALQYAQDYLAKSSLPAHTPISRVPEKTGEHGSFKAYFS